MGCEPTAISCFILFQLSARRNMRPTRATALRGALIVMLVFLAIVLVRTNSSRFWLDPEEDSLQQVLNPVNNSSENAPINTPLNPWEDMLMTPFGHSSDLLIDCPNNDTTKCLNFLRNHEPMQIRNISDELTVFHTAWTGEMVPVHQFLLYSYLATQDLNKSILIYWLEARQYENFTSNPMLAPFTNHPNIYFKCFNLSDLAKDTPLDLSKITDEKQKQDVIGLLDAKGALWGDLVRMLILYKYGGMYVDVDVIFLRPMHTFMQNEFAYLWAAQAGKMNTAVFSLQRGGKSVKTMFQHIIGRKNNFHPWKLYEIIIEQDLPVVLYPAAYFDPVWNIVEKASAKNNLPYDRFAYLFSKVNGEFKFWDGAYAYHFHNMYKTLSWGQDTWAGKLLTQFQEQIRNNANNSYAITGIKPEHADLLVEKCTK